MKRIFNLLLGTLAMLAVALFSAYLAMRIAIHGREVKVPTLAGLQLSEAAKKTSSLGLRLKVENQFYSATVPVGTIIAQSPESGTTVRRAWAVRVTQSLGPQQVSIPNLVGQAERPATITIRRLGLELGTIAHLPAPGPAGVVLAQTPTPSDTAVDSPRMSLLVSAPLPEPTPIHAPNAALADSTSSKSAEAPTPAAPSPGTPAAPQAPTEATPGDQTPANQPKADPANSLVMPSLMGLTLSQAISRTAAAGLHVVSVEDIPASAKPSAPAQPAAQPTTPAPNTVVSQSPPAGQRVVHGDPVKITLSR
jgi:eukaryotic-like serine/threonine-protein kinase